MRQRARSRARSLIDQVRDRVRRRWAPEAASAEQHWLRQRLNDSISGRIGELDCATLTAVEISGSGQAERGWKHFEELDYPAFDLCAPTPQPGQFDVVICQQVLEHVVNPWRAATTLADLCVPGGLVIVSTPFMVRVHELPFFGLRDYWRFTPRGLATLLEQAGLVVDQVDSWGNRDCVAANLDYWAKYEPWHSLRNEDEMPLQVWAFARKPVG
jgi:SAM-dependent methyltransferase